MNRARYIGDTNQPAPGTLGDVVYDYDVDAYAFVSDEDGYLYYMSADELEFCEEAA